MARDVTSLRKMRIWSTALVSLEMYPCSVSEYENPAPTGESRKMILHTWIGQTRLNGRTNDRLHFAIYMDGLNLKEIDRYTDEVL